MENDQYKKGAEHILKQELRSLLSMIKEPTPSPRNGLLESALFKYANFKINEEDSRGIMEADPSYMYLEARFRIALNAVDQFRLMTVILLEASREGITRFEKKRVIAEGSRLLQIWNKITSKYIDASSSIFFEGPNDLIDEYTRLEEDTHIADLLIEMNGNIGINSGSKSALMRGRSLVELKYIAQSLDPEDSRNKNRQDIIRDIIKGFQKRHTFQS